MGGAVAAMGSAIGTGVKAAGSDLYGGARNALFGVTHPVQAAQGGGPSATAGGSEMAPTGSYQDTTMGKLFGAGQGQQETAADRNRRMLAMQQ